MGQTSHPDDGDVVTRSREILHAHWHDGYCVPNPGTYPYLWLWDSCFHAIAWAAVGEPDRALTELRSVFFWQHPDGFVPHMGHQSDPSAARGLWGRAGASTITQPPMYGHAIAELRRRGVEVPAELVSAARRGIEWLVRNRRRADGIVIVHPWESGCDDAPCWDPWCDGPWNRERWRERKRELVDALRLDHLGAAVASPEFEVMDPGFAALVAFNAAELGIDLDTELVPTPPLRPEVLHHLLPALVSDERGLLDAAVDDRAFGGPCGPAGVRRTNPAFDPDAYWRGPAWPQLSYLLWVAARRRAEWTIADDLADRLVAGTIASDYAEYWHPDTGHGLGAHPQSWSALAAVVVTDRDQGP